MTLPDFNENGDLPAGIHRATLPEVLTRFGSGSPQRLLVARRLERIFKLVRSTGKVARFVVFGSFVTKKSDPVDVDIFMLMDDVFEVGSVSAEAAVLFDHMSAANYEGASIFWMRRMAALGGEEAAIAHWQIKRDGTQRGIVEVIAHDS
jgi:predicted nucleotidyltransferase